jgi:hypothetical protein
MSYNVDSTEIIILDAWMLALDIKRLRDEHDDELPENCFLADLDGAEPDDAGRVKLTDMNWRGEGSGYSFDMFVSDIAPFIYGTVEVVFTWEGGDSHSGLAIKDGKVAKCEVTMAIVKPEGW